MRHSVARDNYWALLGNVYDDSQRPQVARASGGSPAGSNGKGKGKSRASPGDRDVEVEMEVEDADYIMHDLRDGGDER